MTKGGMKDFGRHDIQHHLSTLQRLVRWLDAKQVVELGVRAGNSTGALLDALDHTGGQLWSCDVDAPHVQPDVRRHRRWTFHRGDDRTDRALAPERCDLLFIDTTHTLNHTRRELSQYGKQARVIALHDTDQRGVSRAISEWLERNPAHAYIEDPRSHGLGVILT